MGIYVVKTGEIKKIGKNRKIAVDYVCSYKPTKVFTRWFRVDRNDSIKGPKWRLLALKAYGSEDAAKAAAHKSSVIRRAEKGASSVSNEKLQHWMTKHKKTNVRGLIKNLKNGKHVSRKYREPLRQYLTENSKLAKAYLGKHAKRILNGGKKADNA